MIRKLLTFTTFVVFLSAVQCVEITSNVPYYTSENDEILLSCGKTVWDKNNPVTFYMGDTLIYNSGSKDKFPYVSGTKDNRYIILNSKNLESGWQKLYCIADSIISDNTLNIPQVTPPTFSHTPEQFAINQTYKLTCEGAVNPPKNVNINFRFDKYYIGILADGSLSMGNAPGIGLVLSDHGNNWIKMTPQFDIDYGTYYCELEFEVSEKEKTVQKLNVKSKNIWVVTKPKK